MARRHRASRTSQPGAAAVILSPTISVADDGFKFEGAGLQEQGPLAPPRLGFRFVICLYWLNMRFIDWIFLPKLTLKYRFKVVRELY
jgi:hypothetical protein